VSEDPQPEVGPDTPASEYVSPDASPEISPDVIPEISQDLGQDVGHEVKAVAGEPRLSDIVVSHLTDQVRRTTQAAKARRVTNASGEPGVADLTPLRELFTELVEELRRVRARERIARALRDAADIIDPPIR